MFIQQFFYCFPQKNKSKQWPGTGTIRTEILPSKLTWNQRTNSLVNAHLISGPIRFLKVFTINEHGGHLGNVTCTNYINFLSHFPEKLNTTLAKRFQRRRCLIIMVIYMYIAPGQGQTAAWGQILFVNSIIQSIVSFAASFPPLNDFVTVFLFPTYR